MEKNKTIYNIGNIIGFIFTLFGIIGGITDMIVTGAFGQYDWGSYLPLVMSIPAEIINFIAIFLIFKYRKVARILLWVDIGLWFLFFVLILATSPRFLPSNLATLSNIPFLLIAVTDLYFYRRIELDDKKIIYCVNKFKQITIPCDQISSYSFGLFKSVHIGSSSLTIKAYLVEHHKEITKILENKFKL